MHASCFSGGVRTYARFCWSDSIPFCFLPLLRLRQRSEYFDMGDYYFYAGSLSTWQNVSETYNLHQAATPTASRRRSVIDMKIYDKRLSGAFTIMGAPGDAVSRQGGLASASYVWWRRSQANRPAAATPCAHFQASLFGFSVMIIVLSVNRLLFQIGGT